MDTHLFIDIILTEGAIELWHDQNETDVNIRAYLGLNKKEKVFIDLSEDEIPQFIGEDYLEKLGMEDLIGKLPF